MHEELLKRVATNVFVEMVKHYVDKQFVGLYKSDINKTTLQLVANKDDLTQRDADLMLEPMSDILGQITVDAQLNAMRCLKSMLHDKEFGLMVVSTADFADMCFNMFMQGVTAASRSVLTEENKPERLN